jgi:hypothetical protein
MRTSVFICTPSLPLPNIIGLDGLVKGVIFEDKNHYSLHSVYSAFKYARLKRIRKYIMHCSKCRKATVPVTVARKEPF